ncbi:unnamed protein product [Paramecium octaurelia]|uniref:Uncharacterized protein n=1 Tax=Paramecium octaurelia TaxID=43137 RepID=A0A8S1W2U6_PAROT|nr:unnamed protein product [Paramecium octaurelia]
MSNTFNNYLLDQNSSQQNLNPQSFETQNVIALNTIQIESLYSIFSLDQSQFSDSIVRAQFLRNMYSFLTLEFLLNLVMIALAFYTPMGFWLVSINKGCRYEYNEYENCKLIPSWLFYVSLFTSIVLQFTIYFGGITTRNAPINYLLLVLYLIFYGFTFSTICIFMLISLGQIGVWATWGVEAIIIFGTSILLTIILLLATRIWWVLLTAFISIIYGFYLILEARLIIGTGRLNLQPDEYLVGSLLLYGLILQPLVRIFDIVDSRRN